MSLAKVKQPDVSRHALKLWDYITSCKNGERFDIAIFSIYLDRVIPHIYIMPCENSKEDILLEMWKELNKMNRDVFTSLVGCINISSSYEEFESRNRLKEYNPQIKRLARFIWWESRKVDKQL